MAVFLQRKVRERPIGAPGAAGSGAHVPSSPSGGRGSRALGRLRWLLIAGVALFLLAQAVPYGRSHANPPTTAEPRWDSQQTRELAARACFDCHSNLTTWPWYSNLAPVSWLTQRDVEGGRAALNFSNWDKPQDGAGDVASAIAGGSMPPWFYPLMHPEGEPLECRPAATDHRSCGDVPELAAGRRRVMSRPSCRRRCAARRG